MSYIGNQVTSVPHIIDTFGGDGVATTFGPMTRAPAGTASIAVFINGVYKTPGVDYTLNGDYIIFISAPITLSTIVIHHLGNGTTTQVPSDGSVTGTKIAVNAIRGNNIVAGTITGNLIADTAVASNNIVVGAITSNLIASTTISGNNLAPNIIRGNNIVASQITGNLIGAGAISSNHYAGGGVTSDVLAPNLKMSVARMFETGTFSSTAAGGNTNIDINDNLIYFLGSNTTSDITFNIRGNSSASFDSLTSTGQSISVVVGVKHGSTRHKANIAIDGVYITNGATPYASGWTGSLYYTGGIKPTTVAISSAEVNVFTYTILKVGSGTYSVLAGNTIFQI